MIVYILALLVILIFVLIKYKIVMFSSLLLMMYMFLVFSVSIMIGDIFPSVFIFLIFSLGMLYLKLELISNSQRNFFLYRTIISIFLLMIYIIIYFVPKTLDVFEWNEVESVVIRIDMVEKEITNSELAQSLLNHFKTTKYSRNGFSYFKLGIGYEVIITDAKGIIKIIEVLDEDTICFDYKNYRSRSQITMDALESLFINAEND